MSEHTPLPWVSVSDQAGLHDILTSDQKDIVAVEVCVDDAAFICRACNAHAELVAALEEAQEYIEGVHLDRSMMSYREELAERTRVSNLVEISLAKAKGGGNA